MYIVRDAIKATEQACPTLLAARYAALGVKDGEIIRVKLNPALDKAELRCALFNRSNYYSERTVIARIEDGIARKIT